MIKVEDLAIEREKSGMSKTELAERMGVPTSLIDEWENQISEPDRLTLLEIEELFQRASEAYAEEDEGAIVEYIETSALRSTKLGLSIACYICSPVPLLMLLGIVENDFMGGLGVIGLFLMIALGVYFQIIEAGKRYRYRTVEENMLQQGYKSVDTLQKYLYDYEESHAKRLALGILLCILSPSPLIAFAIMFDNIPDFFGFMGTSLMFLMIGYGVYQIVRTSNFKGKIKSGLRKLKRRGYE